MYHLIWQETYLRDVLQFSGLSTVAKLIGCNINELKLSLSKRNMRVGKDTIVQKLTLPQVIYNENYYHFCV